MTAKSTLPTSRPDWYKDAVIYQVHIKSFCDGNGDGIGDFPGLVSRLDYLESLGVTAVWVLPFYPSPLRDDGYDIADYTSVNPDYGTLGDFKRFLREAHARSIRVITELVLNHTSDQHAWFQRARRSGPKSAARNVYVWSDTPDRYREARVIFQDFENSNWTWDPVARAYFWHRFYSHQPDLNFDNPKVHQALFKVLDFWFSMGVDGMRLDAVPYLYEREGTNCENLPETHAFLKKLRAHVDALHQDKMLLAEANQWPEDSVAYFGHGDACHMAFHFPVMPRMFMAVEMENRHPIEDILDQTPAIPESCQWTMFLRNHDELTLEMVTDEERDYMYRIYAKDPRARINLGIRRRLAPLLDNDRRKIELMNVLLMTLPGSPVIYYGDEIGMGDNYHLGDRDGVRTPMQWSEDKNAGFSKANPQKLYLPVVIDPEYHYGTVNVEVQETRQSSLLWWMRRMISVRRAHRVFGRGDIRFLAPDNAKVLAYLRSFQDETVLVVANLSRHSQSVELDLAGFEGHVPQDLFSRNMFRPVENGPYAMTLSPYAWFLLRLHAPEEAQAEPSGLPALKAPAWESLLDHKESRRRMEAEALPAYLPRQRWFGGKARTVRKMSVMEWFSMDRDPGAPMILLVQVDYTDGQPEIYILPLAFQAADEDREPPRGLLAKAEFRTGRGWVYEAVFDRRFCDALLAAVAGRQRFSTGKGRLTAASTRFLNRLWKGNSVDLTPRLLGAEQSNTSILYGESFILKLYRRTEKGAHPDVEIVRYLTEKAGFPHIPPYAGSLEYALPRGGTVVLGLMQEFVPNQGDAWTLFLDLAGSFFERVLSLGARAGEPPDPPGSLLPGHGLPEPLDELMAGVTLEMAERLGERTGMMHLALAAAQEPSMAPEPFSRLWQRSVFQSMQNQLRQEFRLLRRNLCRLEPGARAQAEDVLGLEKDITARMRLMTDGLYEVVKTRIHGDYHLGQVLYTGRDFVLFDFEGEPRRPLSERRLKRSPVRDVAGMVRSFHYAAHSALLKAAFRDEDKALLGPWSELWRLHVGGVFLEGYLKAAAGSDVIPQDRERFLELLTPLLLEKTVHEMGRALDNRPNQLSVPLDEIKRLCGERP